MYEFRSRFIKYTLLGLLMVTVPLYAHSDEYEKYYRAKKCSNHSLKGTYAFYQNGEVNGQGAVADVGVFIADGKGNITGSEVVHLFDGRVVEIMFCNGYYEIKDTCVGNFVWDAVVGGPCGVGTSIGERTHTVTLGKKDVYILSTTPGTVLVGIGTKR